MARKKKAKTDQELNLEARKINYSLRSTFFYRKLHELGYFTIIKIVESLVKESANYSWEDRKFWLITHNAWDHVLKEAIEPIRVFTHPKILVEHPKLISYYRNVAAIPLKGVQYLAFNVTDYETEKRSDLKYERALKLAKLFNSHTSAIIESTLSVDFEKIKSLMFASAGATVDGSWRNKVGEEAETIVKSYILRLALEKDMVASFIDTDGCPVPFRRGVDYVSNVQHFRGFKLKNKKSVLFGSEPDISFIDKGGKPTCAIEVKGGTDPAGALERLGAIKKSFEHALRSNKKANTILLASCITTEMSKRLRRDPNVKLVFNLTEIISDLERRELFLRKIEEELIK
jgi:hypothetical protein